MVTYCCVCGLCGGDTFDAATIDEKAEKATKCSSCKSKYKYIVNTCYKVKHRYYCLECQGKKLAQEKERLLEEDQEEDQEKDQEDIPKPKKKKKNSKNDLATEDILLNYSILSDNTTDASESTKEDDEMTKKSDSTGTNITNKDNNDDDTSSESCSPSKTTSDKETVASEPKRKRKRNNQKKDDKGEIKTKTVEELENFFSTNMDYLKTRESSSLDITAETKFILSETPSESANDDEIIDKVVQRMSETAQGRSNATNEANKTDLQVIEEWFFFHWSNDRIKSSSFIAQFNKIFVWLCNRCKEKHPTFEVRVIRRWAHCLAVRITKNIWNEGEAEASSQKDLAIQSSPVFLKIIELLKETMMNEEYFPLLRRQSIMRCIKANNCHKYRQNQYDCNLENVGGTETDQTSCDKAYKVMTDKRESKKKTISLVVPEKVKTDIETPCDVSQSTLDNFFKPLAIQNTSNHKAINHDHLLSLSLDELVNRFSNLFTGGIDAVAKVLAGSKANGSSALLNLNSIIENEMVLRKLIAYLERYSPQLSHQNSLGGILTSSDVTYMILKFVDAKTELSVIKSDGFCYYRVIFISFFAYIHYPFKSLADDPMSFPLSGPSNDINVDDRFEMRTELVTDSGKISLFKESQFRNEFSKFWKSIIIQLQKEDSMVALITKFDNYGLNKFLENKSSDAHGTTPFDNLLKKISSMAEWIEVHKNKEEESLPPASWLDDDDVRLLSFLISNIYGSKSKLKMDPTKAFIFNIFMEINVTKDNNIEAELISTLDKNSANFPYAYRLQQLADNTKSCLLLSHSTIRLDEELSVEKRLFTSDELKKLADPSSYLVLKNSHVETFSKCCLDYKEISELIGIIAASIIRLLKSEKIINLEDESISNFSLPPNSNSPLPSISNSPLPLTSRQIKTRLLSLSQPREKTTIPSVPMPQGELTQAHVIKRHSEIKIELKNRDEFSIAVDLTEDGRNRLFGTLAVYDLQVRHLDALAKIDDSSMIGTDLINTICAIVNMESYERNPSSMLLALDIYLVSNLSIATIDSILNNTIQVSVRADILALRMKYASILLFPLYHDCHFMLIIMLPFVSMIFFFDSLTSSITEKVDWKMKVMENFVVYFNSIHSSSRNQTKPFPEWEKVIDGFHTTQSLPQQGRTLNCGVYVCSYLMKIGFCGDIDRLISLFRTKEYHSFFESINPDTILYNRKLLTVQIVDREKN